MYTVYYICSKRFLGDCGCEPTTTPRRPPPPPEKKTDLDLVFLVDGSDSFDASKIGDEWKSGQGENSGMKGWGKT